MPFESCPVPHPQFSSTRLSSWILTCDAARSIRLKASLVSVPRVGAALRPSPHRALRRKTEEMRGLACIMAREHERDVNTAGMDCGESRLGDLNAPPAMCGPAWSPLRRLGEWHGGGD